MNYLKPIMLKKVSHSVWSFASSCTDSGKELQHFKVFIIIFRKQRRYE